MSDDQTTKTDLGAGLARSALPSVPLLTVAYHPEPRRLGARVALADGEDLVLGRACVAFGPEALRDPLVSRQHARVCRRGEEITIHDLDSHNGTFVDGERITSCQLPLGSIVSVGAVHLLCHAGPLIHRPAASPVLVGTSSALGEVVDELERCAREPVCVLVQGESGVGKELVASEIHRLSGVTGPFVAVNCGGLADGLVHSELFGHLRSAFSGAEDERRGLVGSAAHGTLFLDEIGDASPSLQASLLRLLEQREYRPVGGDQLLHTDARFVAATHVPLEHAVEHGRFRSDLYGRLRRWVIQVPALRERREDVIPLALHFARQHAGRPLMPSRELALALLRHAWPNNVRELAALVERAVVEAGTGKELELTPPLAARLGRSEARAADVASGKVPHAAARSEVLARPKPVPRAPLSRPEPAELRATLAAVDHNVVAFAARLGISRRTAYRWLEESGIELRQLRDEERRR